MVLPLARVKQIDAKSSHELEVSGLKAGYLLLSVQGQYLRDDNDTETTHSPHAGEEKLGFDTAIQMMKGRKSSLTLSFTRESAPFVLPTNLY